MILPELLPALLTGFSLAFARGLGEYGSVIFIAGNLPFKTEIAPLLITIRLEEYDYNGAVAIAALLLAASFVCLLAINAIPALFAHGSAMLTPQPRDPLQSPAWLRWALIALAVVLMALLVVLPLAMVLGAAFAKGIGVWFAALVEPDARAALKLTLLTAAIVIPLNAFFGVLTAWAVTRFEFRGKRVLLALIDLPFAVSPVVAGLCLVLLFGIARLVRRVAGGARHQDPVRAARDRAGDAVHHLPVRGARTDPADAAAGRDEELAARSLGAGAWTMFRRVTLPNIKWGLLYGVLLCSARAMGEFGAVSVVSGHIRGLTNTLPLHIEILYNEFDSTAAFAAASLLAGLALVTLVLKFWLEARHGDALAQSHRRH